MLRAFEDPRKTDLRERFLVALDAAGYEVSDDAEPIAIPGGRGLQGRIVGDVQAISGEGVRTIFCLRPSSTRPAPTWLANWARATLEMENVELYVVVDETPSADLERSCEASGAGLLILRVEGIEIVIKAGDVPLEIRDEACRKRVTDLRRRLDNKLRLHLDAIEADFTEAQELTAAFPDELQDDYMKGIELHGIKWRQWSEDISQALDSVLASCDEEELQLIEEMLERDPA
jgi:hypothetical protein